jgi:hypothetical protein
MKLFDAAPFRAVALVEPVTTNWLHLPSLHAELLPLAIAAGHDALQLGCAYGSDAPSGCTYEATGIGGEAGNRFYVTWLEPGDGDTAPRFAQVLREKLLAAAQQQRLTSQLAA